MAGIDTLEIQYPIPESVTRAEALADELEAHLSRNDLASGARLGTKEEIRQRSGLAVATVNEAIRLLVHRGRVTVRPGIGGGVFVAEQPPSVRLGRLLLNVRGDEGNTFEHATVVRNALDPLVMEDVAAHYTKHDFNELRRLLEEMARAVPDPREFLDANWNFHSIMAAMCENRILAAIYSGLMETIRHGTTVVIDKPGAARDRKVRLAIHRDILAGIEKGDLSRVGEAAHRHSIIAVHSDPTTGSPKQTVADRGRKTQRVSGSPTKGPRSQRAPVARTKS